MMTHSRRRSLGASASCVNENERAVALYKGEVKAILGARRASGSPTAATGWRSRATTSGSPEFVSAYDKALFDKLPEVPRGT